MIAELIDRLRAVFFLEESYIVLRSFCLSTGEMINRKRRGITTINLTKEQAKEPLRKGFIARRP